MAVWGAPVAREDDAERAVRAALELVDAVAAWGRASRRGRACSPARPRSPSAPRTRAWSRATSSTPPRASSRWRRRAPCSWANRPCAPRPRAHRVRAGRRAGLKGKEAPGPRVARAAGRGGGRWPRPAARAWRRRSSGRDDEMRLLKDLFHATARERRVRLVSVVGPAGIGKSRLAWEFLKYIDGLVETVWWHQGRSPAYGEGISFWALGEMVRAAAASLESDDERTTRAQVAATVAEHVPDAAERRWIEPALLTLLGVGERHARRTQLFAAWRTFFERMAATGAGGAACSRTSTGRTRAPLDFIDHLLDWSRDLPIFVVTLARPELLERRPDWGAGKRHFTSLSPGAAVGAGDARAARGPRARAAGRRGAVDRGARGRHAAVRRGDRPDAARRRPPARGRATATSRSATCPTWRCRRRSPRSSRARLDALEPADRSLAPGRRGAGPELHAGGARGRRGLPAADARAAPAGPGPARDPDRWSRTRARRSAASTRSSRRSSARSPTTRSPSATAGPSTSRRPAGSSRWAPTSWPARWPGTTWRPGKRPATGRRPTRSRRRRGSRSWRRRRSGRGPGRARPGDRRSCGRRSR